MSDVMIRLSQLALPVFIFATMLNIGLTQQPGRIVGYWRDRSFVAWMLLANFVGAPLAMWLLLQILPLPLGYKAALFVYSLTAGAPFLIKLTASAGHDLALGAATMMLLVLATIVAVPLALPALLPGLSIDAGALARTLLRQLLLPIALGALLAYFLPGIARRVQPWVSTAGNLALYLVLVSTIVGYLPLMAPIVRSGALVIGLLFVLAAFGLGWLAGRGSDSLEDIGGLATAQRNTAAAMLIAVASFDDPNVLVLITLVSALGMLMLIVIARGLKRDNTEVSLI